MNEDTITVSLEDGAERIREQEIPEIEELRQGVKEDAREARQNGDAERYYMLEQEFDEYETRLTELDGQAEWFEKRVDEWEDTEYTFRALTMGQVRMAGAEVSAMVKRAKEANDETSEAVANDGTLYQSKAVEKALVDKPEDAPPIQDHIMPITKFLYEAVNSYNTAGRLDLGNSSLSQALRAED